MLHHICASSRVALSLIEVFSRLVMAEGKESILLVITWAFVCERSSDDWKRFSNTERCRSSTGGASASTEQVLPTRPETEATASWGWKHPFNLYYSRRAPSPHRHAVPEPSGSQADVEGHRRRSPKSISQPSSTRESSRDSSFPWHHLNTLSLWSHW